MYLCNWRLHTNRTRVTHPEKHVDVRARHGVDRVQRAIVYVVQTLPGRAAMALQRPWHLLSDGAGDDIPLLVSFAGAVTQLVRAADS